MTWQQQQQQQKMKKSMYTCVGMEQQGNQEQEFSWQQHIL
jgi:hypothetical protein